MDYFSICDVRVMGGAEVLKRGRYEFPFFPCLLRSFRATDEPGAFFSISDARVTRGGEGLKKNTGTN